jgi:hypothetical protein
MAKSKDYQPPYTITSAILNLVAQIGEAIGRLTVLTDFGLRDCHLSDTSAFQRLRKIERWDIAWLILHAWAHVRVNTCSIWMLSMYNINYDNNHGTLMIFFPHCLLNMRVSVRQGVR